MTARAIGPLQAVGSEILVVPGRPLSLGWTAPLILGNSSIEVVLELTELCGTRARILCNAEDLDSLTIPAALVSRLIEFGVAGYPTLSITRKAMGSAEIPQGRVQLLLVSGVELPVVVAGFTSCRSDEDCTGGQTCSVTHLCQS
jgi:hypothetical protein